MLSLIAITDGQHGLILAVDARTEAKVAVLVLLEHEADAAVGEHVARVYEAVEHLGRLLDQIALVRVVVELLVGLQVEYHVERLAIVRHLFVQAGQIELVLYVVLVDLAEELIAAQAAEPRYPRDLFRAAHDGLFVVVLVVVVVVVVVVLFLLVELFDSSSA